MFADEPWFEASLDSVRARVRMTVGSILNPVARVLIGSSHRTKATNRTSH